MSVTASPKRASRPAEAGCSAKERWASLKRPRAVWSQGEGVVAGSVATSGRASVARRRAAGRKLTHMLNTLFVGGDGFADAAGDDALGVGVGRGRSDVHEKYAGAGVGADGV